MFEELLIYLKKPEAYTEGTAKLWDDEHVSKGMLEAHLNPELEAASRRHDFINQSVEWISQIVPSKDFGKLLDLGCGPGLYTERLYEKGYKVTGIDFSKRSVAYAKKQARLKKMAIPYIYQDYLELDYKDEFDTATLIYCDYGALSDKQRAILLNKVYNLLKKEGKFIFDVFTSKEYENLKESNTWYISEGNSFWRPHKHICLESHFIYEEDLRLNQYVIIDNDKKVDVVRVWLKWFTKETLLDELKKAGFSKFEVYGDVTGAPYHENSRTICVAAEK